MSSESTQQNAAAPDLAALVSHYQKLLRLQDWRIEVGYERDLNAPNGRPAWGLCSPNVDAKTAAILIRDPATPPEGSTPEEALAQVTETIVHELCHLHFAAFGNRTPAAIVAEEQAVWALAEALVKAHGSPTEEQTIARAMVASIARPEAVRHAEAEGSMDKKLATEALDALTAGDTDRCAEILKSVIVGAAAGEAATGEEPPPVEPLPDAAVAPAEDEEKPEDEMLAVARVALSLSGKRTAGEAIEELTRRSRIVGDLERREAEVAKSRKVIEASERRELVAKLVHAGEPPAMAWAPDADGVPDGKTPAEPWASMPLASLRARVAKFGGKTLSHPRPPPEDGTAGLSDYERAMCARRKIDPLKYVAIKAAATAKKAGG